MLLDIILAPEWMHFKLLAMHDHIRCLFILSPYVTPSSPLNVTTPGDLLIVALSSDQDVKTQVDTLNVIPSPSSNVKTPDDRLGPPLNVKAHNVISTSVTITWEPPQNPNGGPQGYEVSYTPKGGTTCVAKLKTFTTCKRIEHKPFTPYYICVRAKTAVLFGEESVPLTISTLEDGKYIDCYCVHEYTSWNTYYESYLFSI